MPRSPCPAKGRPGKLMERHAIAASTIVAINSQWPMRCICAWHPEVQRGF